MTLYIGPFRSETGTREMGTELRLDHSELDPFDIQIEVASHRTGSVARTLYIPRAKAVELRDALTTLLDEEV